MISKFCILYLNDSNRVENYNINKSIINDLQIFPAIDTINEFDKYFEISKKYLTNDYIEYCNLYRGKLGCNLSHLLLLENFITNDNNDWLLVLEDDVSIINLDLYKLNNLINLANNNNSHFIQLYTHPRFIKKQCRKFAKIGYGVYKMMPQIGALAYLISKTGAKIILDNLPITRNIDVYFSQIINKLNSLCYINNMFINRGNLGITDKSELGSIIYSN